MNVGGAVIGGVAGGLIANKGVPMVLKNASPLVRNLVPLGLGTVASVFFGNNPFVVGVANGMVATSSKNITTSFIPQIAGIGAGDAANLLDVPDDELISLEGTYDTFDESVQGAGEFDDFVNGPYDY